MFPTEKHYRAIQTASKNNAFNKDYDAFKKDYTAFKKDYDDLKKEFYETRSFFDSTHDTMTDVWQFNRVKGEERHGHATPKPVVMIERIIKSSSQEKVIEPFLGSGSTLIACEKTKRKCYGMEIDPHYCDVIVKRWEEFTGNKAERVERAES
jgi:DNA modification methylase